MNVRMNKLLIVTLVTILAVLSLPMQAFAATSGTHTPVEGITVKVSGATDNSMSNGAVTVTAKGSSGLFGIGASAKTATITIINEKSKEATISFDWTASSVNELKIDGTVYSGTSNSFSKQLEAGASFTITITTAKNGTTNTLVMSNFAIAEVKDSSSITVLFNEGYSVSVDDASVSLGDVVSVPGAGATMSAPETDFVAWINDADNTVLSKLPAFVLKPTADMTIKAINTTNACFEVGNKLYETLTEAITAATSGTVKTIVLANNGTLPADDYTIPSGVTLLIPFNDSYDVYTDATAYAGETMVTPTAYRTLTLAEGTNIIVNGSMNVAGKFAYTNSGGQSGSPSGPLGFVNMASGSNITVNGKLYAYGYIIGDGTVTVNSGATVYEVLQMPEFRGGDQSTGMDNKVFPLSQFYVQNIEVPMTIYQGATEETFASVYVYGGGLINKYFPTGIKLFGSGGMFELGSANQYITKWYDGSTDRLHIKINGDVSMNSIQLVMNAGILGSQSINSKDYVLPINGGFTIHIESGSLSIPSTQEVLLQPGAQVIIDEGATCTVNSNLYIYDAAQWGAYSNWGHAGAGDTNCWDTPSIPVSYSPTRTKVRLHVFPRGLFTDSAGNPLYITEDDNIYKSIFAQNKGDMIAEADLAEYLTLLPDASIQVDGTLTGNIYTTAGGANIFSTGSGTFTQTATVNSSVYQLMMGSDYSFNSGNAEYYVEASSTPAQLKNSDDTFVTTATNPATYNYIDGYWVAADCGRLDIVATNIAVNDGLDVRFYVDMADMDAGTIYTAVITKSFADNRTPVTKVVTSESWAPQPISDTVTYKYFTFEDVSAKEMMDNIEVKIYTDYVDAANPGVQVSNTFVETIQNYAIRTLAPILTAIEKQTATDEDRLLASALADMLQYGAAAQVHFKYNTEQLATEEPESLAEKYQGVLAKGCGYATKSPVAMVDQRETGNNFKGVTVSATNTLMFTFYFGIENPEGMYAKITYTDSSNTVHVQQEVQGSDFYARSPGSLYGVDVTELSIVDGRLLLTCTVYNADGTTYGSATDSIEGYAARKSDSTDEAIDIFERIMMFVDSAGAYFEQVSQSSGG